MSTFLPVGYFRWVPTFTLDGSTKIFQTVFMGHNGTSVDASDINTQMRGFFQVSNSRPFHAAEMYVGYTLARTECWRAVTGEVQYHLNETAVVGTKTGSNGSPINTSILVRKNTGLSGRLYRGRFMLPNMSIPESAISQAGIITSGDLVTYAALWASAMSAWNASTLDPVLGHSSSEVAPTDYLTVTPLPKVGSMPRRIR